MDAVQFLIETLLELLLMAVLLRLIMQWTRADFRNPLARAIVQVTNPILVPLRRILPAAGRVDTAAVLVVLVIGAVLVLVPRMLYGLPLPSPLTWLIGSLLTIARLCLMFYLFAIIIYALASMLAPAGGYSPAQNLLQAICEPVLQPVRRVIPPLGEFDLSPLWVALAIGVLLRLLPG